MPANPFPTKLRLVETSVKKTLTNPSGGADVLFTVTGDPILITGVYGIVRTTLVGTANGTLRQAVTTPSGNVGMSTTVAIDDDAAGTSYRFVGATGVLTPVTAGAKIIDPVTVEDVRMLMPIGNLHFLSSAALTGVIDFYITYIPLSPLSLVTVA